MDSLFGHPSKVIIITDEFEWAMWCVDFKVNLSLKTQGAKSVGRRLIEFPILKLMQHADCFKKTLASSHV